MAKSKEELTSTEFNNQVWAEIKKLEDNVIELKSTLKPAELAKQATLHECNMLAAKALSAKTKVNPKLLAEENTTTK